MFQLTIKVTDVNDNPPKFDLPDYQAHNIDEDIPIGSSILRVNVLFAFFLLLVLSYTMSKVNKNHFLPSLFIQAMITII